ncbi:terminase TerL endonuclease subunit [Bacillus sp. FSL W7-1360]
MISHPYVDDYISLYETGKIKFNKERRQLINYLREHVFVRNDLYFDDQQIDQCVRYIEKWYFPLQPFQKFIIAFFFLVNKKTGRLHYRRYLIMMGRGGGKNGLISGLTNYLNSELHGIREYHISIVANSEEQAKTSFEEIYNVIDANKALQKSFYLTKLKITNKKTQSTLRFRTSNANTKDGGREGAVVFDEIHEYADRKTVNVFKSGLGKKKYPREIYIGTDGFLREGFLDTMKERAREVLKGEKPNSNLFPFICKLDKKEQVHDVESWELANPMFCHPRGEYAQNLLETVLEEYEEIGEDASAREEFMTKRMNMPEVNLERSVALWEDVQATDRPFPVLAHRECIGGLDFAEIKDFAAVGLLFKVGDEYIWKTHSFVRRGFLEAKTLKVPIYEWEEKGLLTIVEGPVIEVSHVVEWFVKMRESYGLRKIIVDTFRLSLVKSALEAEGFEIEYIRNPKAIHSWVAPKVDTIFAKRQLVFGDNPLMRWYTNNVYVHTRKDGNKEYLKKDEYRRKTDGFQALIHALWKADELEEATEFMLGSIDF